jgi:peptidoglycan/LPS O-acetylase OafA/YrhL
MPALDGLRALSVAMVFTVHALPQLRFPGGLGVDIFFVISGFLITRILLKEYRRTGRIDLVAFYLKRALRLYPALLLACLSFMAFFFVLRRAMPEPLVTVTIVALTYVSNIWMNATGEYIGHLSHTWSLAMEEQFYVVWPLLLLLLLRVRKPAVILAVLAAAGLAAWAVVGSDQPYNPLIRAGGLLVGCLVAFLVEKRPWQNTGLAYAAVLVFIACVTAESMGLVPRELTLPVVSLTLPFVILHLAFGSGPLVRLLSSRVLVHLGVLSYGLYLWHYVVLAALGMLGYKYGLTMALIAAGITYVAAVLSFRFVEQPILQLKARIPVKEPAPVPA